MRHLRVFALFTVCLLFAFKSSGQLYNFTNYSLEQGLPQSSVYSIFQDSRGYLWLGTESGVARFDGLRFTVFDRTSGLPGNTVRSIIELANGDIWVGTDMGIAFYNGSSWKQITTKDGLKGSAVMKLATDSKGRVWAASNDDGVNIINIDKDSVIIENLNKDRGLSANFVFDIFHTTNGQTMLALFGGINTVSQIDGKYIVHDIQDSVLLPSNLITCIDQDKSGNFWCGTYDAGAFELVKKHGAYSVVPIQNNQGLTDSRIWDVYCDTSGDIWFGSNDNGLYRLSNGNMQNISLSNGLPGSMILSIYKDRNRNLWFGSINSGFSLFRGFQLVHYSSEDGLPGTSVLAIREGNNQSLWVGGDGKGLAQVTLTQDKLNSKFFGKGSGFVSKEVKSLDINSSGNLLVGTQSDGLAIMQNENFRYFPEDELLNDKINCVIWSKYGSIYAGTDLGYNEIKENKIHAITEDLGLINPEVQTVVSDSKGNIWMGTMGGLVKFHPVTGNYRDFNEQEGLFDLSIHSLAIDKNDQVYIGTTNGIYRFDEKKDTIVSIVSAGLTSKTINSLLFYNDTTLIVGTNLGFNKIFFDKSLSIPKRILSYDKTNGFKFIETNQNAICKDSRGRVWFGTVNGLTRYQPELEDTITETPIVHLTGIRLSFESVDWKAKGLKVLGWSNIPQNLTLKYYQNHITFDFDGLNLRNPEKVRYRYKLEPNDNAWSPSISNNSVTFPGLNNGSYTFKLCASNDGIHWSEPISYQLIITPPFWKTIWFYLILLVLVVTGLIIYIRYREQKLMREKEYLEQVVKERTAEVVAQKDCIEQQHKIVTHQKEEITASITYARRIQQAVLPGVEVLSENTADSFVLYKPRDIVSGDFYWIGKSGNLLVVTAADCTGHGVPGAFMSMLGISFMNKIIKEQKIEMPNEVLGQMRNNVITSLKQGNYEGTTKDGMDMALCVINLDTLMMTFAGAYNPAVIVSNGEAQELKADRMPVGLHMVMDDFTTVNYQLKKGDCVYLFSDGYQDQMGGPTNRKFMRKNLRELLESIHSKPFCEQREILDNTVENWRRDPALPDGEVDQMDDILVLGFTV
ncbi:MAG TPA: hypothetical protein DIW31_03045 [Bacteroidales bacterium]|nr:hypothetical protein [Bacteroidales bacterium]